MKNVQDIENMLININNRINSITRDLSKAISKGNTYEQNNYMNEISRLQRQEETLRWVMN